ncbi:MAG: hypothetical protein KBD27_02175 [Candidatus Moranbacteria bacterium]|nr:hypothetical protein [Candidatus Moranbacteria bacterium]
MLGWLAPIPWCDGLPPHLHVVVPRSGEQVLHEPLGDVAVQHHDDTEDGHCHQDGDDQRPNDVDATDPPALGAGEDTGAEKGAMHLSAE